MIDCRSQSVLVVAVEKLRINSQSTANEIARLGKYRLSGLSCKILRVHYIGQI